MSLINTDDNLSMNEALQKRLKAVLNGTQEAWTYAIFWKPSYYDFFGEPVLKWGDGFYNADQEKTRRRRKKTIPSCPEEKARRSKVLQELRSIIPGEAFPVVEEDYDDDNDVEVTDTEWFYLVSMTWSFSSGSGLAGKAFSTYNPVWVTGSDHIYGSGCDRAKQGVDSGLRTNMCVPYDNGVLELGSTEEIRQNSDLFNKIRFLFNLEASKYLSGAPNSTSKLFSTDYPNQDPNLVYLQFVNSLNFSTSYYTSTRDYVKQFSENLNPNFFLEYGCFHVGILNNPTKWTKPFAAWTAFCSPIISCSPYVVVWLEKIKKFDQRLNTDHFYKELRILSTQNWDCLVRKLFCTPASIQNLDLRPSSTRLKN